MLITEIADKNNLLSVGSTGPKVRVLQETLIKAGQELPIYGPDGKYGAETKKAVEVFQEMVEIKVDGIVGPQTVNELKWYAYSNFRKKEFKCKCNKYCNGYPVEVDEKLLYLLQKIRDHLDKPVIITSGIRCKKYNKAVGGVSRSQHLYGTAADVIVKDVSADRVYFVADKINPKGGVGRYKTYTHIDSRDGRARW